MADESTTKGRIIYTSGMILDENDFQDEQAYHIQNYLRQNCLLFHWGVVWGLGCSIDNSNVTINSGLAIDGFGREVMLANQYSLAKKDGDICITFQDKDNGERKKSIAQLAIKQSSIMTGIDIVIGKISGNILDTKHRDTFALRTDKLVFAKFQEMGYRPSLSNDITKTYDINKNNSINYIQLPDPPFIPEIALDENYHLQVTGETQFDAIRVRQRAEFDQGVYANQIVTKCCADENEKEKIEFETVVGLAGWDATKQLPKVNYTNSKYHPFGVVRKVEPDAIWVVTHGPARVLISDTQIKVNDRLEASTSDHGVKTLLKRGGACVGRALEEGNYIDRRMIWVNCT